MYVSVMNGASIIAFGASGPTPPAELAALTRPEYRDRFPQWTRIRDCIEGEDVVKARKTTYLPMRAKQEEVSYNADLQRAVFFNATGRTRMALLSSVFRRPGVERLPNGMDPESVTQDGMSVKKVARWLTEEVITVSRAGAYVDLPEGDSTMPQPYLCLYPAECILSWAVEKGALRMVLLAERVLNNELTQNMFNVQSKWQCRMLALDENGEYFQLAGDPKLFSNMSTLPVEGRKYPIVYGRRLRSIPFQFFGVVKNTEEIEKPLLLDIADLNIKHFQSSANLERARAFVGSPVYTTFTGGKSQDDDEALIVSPEIVWEFDQQDKAEILEFKGTGMSSLENGLEEKEEQMRVLGARLLSQRKNAAARSAQADSDSSNSDDATLVDVVTSVSEGLTNLFRIIAGWKRLRESEVEIILNRHFSSPNVGARELRAIDACLNRSLRPEDIFELLKEAGLIRDDEDKEAYVAWVEELRAVTGATSYARSGGAPTPTRTAPTAPPAKT